MYMENTSIINLRIILQRERYLGLSLLEELDSYFAPSLSLMVYEPQGFNVRTQVVLEPQLDPNDFSLLAAHSTHLDKPRHNKVYVM